MANDATPYANTDEVEDAFEEAGTGLEELEDLIRDKQLDEADDKLAEIQRFLERVEATINQRRNEKPT
jgi:CHASE3 domain sensor protein